VTEARSKLKAGEHVAVRLPPAIAAEPQAETIPLDIVYEDSALIVIDKPAGLVVHPAAGHETGTLVNALIAHCSDSLSGIGGVRRPGIVHRLDKDTSGLLVVAKTDQAHKGLSEQFAAHGRDGRLERAYLALVWGAPERRLGTVDAPIGRHTTAREKMRVASHGGARKAVTHYDLVEGFGSPPYASLLRCRLETGRTHQIRVHMAHIGHPLLGDETYGKGFKASIAKLPHRAQIALKALGRQALHAAVLGFEHPVTGASLHFESLPPADLAALISALSS
jgi:23S rRNA pseudouridine1911/1915/1917 synthase